MIKITVIKLKKIEREPKIYAIDLHCVETGVDMIWLGMAYTLDDAFALAKQHFASKGMRIQNLKLNNHTSETVQDLVKPFQYTDQDQKNDKNALMKQILDENNYMLYLKHKDSFTINERAFLLDRIKISHGTD